MKIGKVTKYPWYQELVAITSFLYILASAYLNWNKLPPVMATHFNAQGVADGFQSKSAFLITMLIILAFGWSIDAAFRYLHLCQEKTKKFNFVQILTAPGLVVVAWGWFVVVDINLNQVSNFNNYWLRPELYVALALSTTYIIFMENRRQKHAVEKDTVIPPARDFSDSKNFLYVENHNTHLWKVGSVLVAFFTILASLLLFIPCEFQPWLAITGVVSILGALFGLCFCKGYEYRVSHKAIEVRLAFINLLLKEIPVDNIKDVKIMEYAPLPDFGGWGIRGNKTTLAYILTGTVGTCIETHEGKDVLLSTHNPESLAAIIRKVKELDLSAN